MLGKGWKLLSHDFTLLQEDTTARKHYYKEALWQGDTAARKHYYKEAMWQGDTAARRCSCRAFS